MSEAGKQQVGSLAVDALLQRMQIQPDDADAQMEACGLLNDLYDKDPGHWNGKDNSIIAKTLMNAMKKHLRNVNLLIKLFEVLAKFTQQSAQNLDFFIEEGGFETILEVMKEHVDSRQVQICACIMLNVVGEYTLRVPHDLTRAAASAVVTAMRTHIQSTKVVEVCMAVLHSLRSELNQSIADNSVEIIIKCMRTHAQHQCIQAYGCGLLSELVAMDESSIPKMWALNALPTLVASMNTILRSETIVRELDGMPFDTQIYFDKFCLTVIQMYYRAQEEQAEPGLKILLQIMTQHAKKSPQLAMHAFEAISQSCNNSPRNKEILSEQACQAILRVMEAHKDNIDVQSFGLSALYCLAFKSQTNSTCLANGASLRTLLRSSEMFSQNQVARRADNSAMVEPLMRKFGAHASSFMEEADRETREKACALFGTMVEQGDSRLARTMLKAGCVRGIVKVMSHKADSESGHVAALRQGARALTSMVSRMHNSVHGAERETFSILVQEGGIDAVINAMSVLKSEETLQQMGCYTLTQLFLHCPDQVQVFGLRVIRPVLVGLHACFDPRRISRSLLSALHGATEVFNIITAYADEFPNHRSYLDAFGEHGWVKAACTCLRICNGEYDAQLQPEAMERKKELQPQWPICVWETLAAAVCGHKVNQDRVRQELQLVELTLSLMDKHSRNSEAQYSGCRALYAFTNKHKDNTEMVLRKGALRRVTHAANVWRNERDMDMRAFVLSLHSTLSLVNVPEEVSASIPSGGLLDTAATSHHGEKVCSGCGKTAADAGVAKLLRCNACTIAPLYCGAACQTACWQSHKAACKANRKNKT
jgi:hypothetical protein